ncbi:hypothetical protein BGZ57DRAFT_147744 [Hyaloscypha finlandica]|nr:hypothetical protein BGZ57DRAFT_147744 [Hyaloscypha finlandica]
MRHSSGCEMRAGMWTRCRRLCPLGWGLLFEPTLAWSLVGHGPFRITCRGAYNSVGKSSIVFYVTHVQELQLFSMAHVTDIGTNRPTSEFPIDFEQ